MRRSEIVVHHVGARGVGAGLIIPSIFNDDTVSVLYEADAVCAQEMAEANTDSSIKILPYCLGADDSSGVLHITRNPYFSSLLKPDHVFEANSCQVELSGEIDGVPVWGALYDALYRNEMAVVKSAPVQIRSMDSLFRDKVVSPDLLPDFMILDTQGTEFEILCGARSVISQGMLGFATEIEFTPMYAGQKLFADILKFAEQNGFRFAGFTYLQDVNTGHLPLGLRSKGLLAFGDCLFFRDPASLRQIFPEDAAFLAAGLKLAFVALSFGFLSFAVELLQQGISENLGKYNHAKMQERMYFRFMKELSSAIAAMPRSFLYTDRYELASAWRNRLQGAETQKQDAAGPPRSANTITTTLRNHSQWLAKRMKDAARPVLGPVIRRLRVLSKGGRVGDGPSLTGTLRELSLRITEDGQTSVEKLLVQYGFNGLAVDLEDRRRKATPYIHS